MSSNTPDNPNFLQGHSYEFVCLNLPETTFYVQRANIPGLSLATVPVPYGSNPVPETGDKVDFTPFFLTFKVDEEMESYFEIWDWIVGLGFPNETQQYKRLKENRAGVSEPTLFSDATLTVRNSKKNEKLRLNFRGIFPTSLSDIELGRDVSDIPYPVATATFVYLYYEYERI